MMKDTTALRKRAQIARANRMMFVWVAGISAIVGLAVVTSIFLFQKLVFNEKILGEKQATISALEYNNNSVEALKNDVRALESNAALISAKANEDDSALQVILDALPSDGNSLALGASLQYRLIGTVKGVKIETLQVDPVIGVESETGVVEDAASSEATGEEVKAITFRFTVVGSSTELQKLLAQFERSIRTIDITSMVIESRGNAQAMSIEGRAFYEPAKTVELTDKVVAP